ncbi:hypothetical protein HOK51_08365 [Candidatus Woesearchaeota archaeon]|jgi:benzylmalate synthase|nr:hypothetical protein [Candidatus Woesearchaeota archaeon]MBT6519839.1 hypothetical protein [Candidatus Woesearchaeota archaeon]MBT7366888.1 hypothetical protein [Candidatus Woesearchaeota archaeon]
MVEIYLKISEEVLRDGQQDPRGISFNFPEMIDLAQEIYKIGPAIYNIDIMPVMHPMHEHAARVLSKQKIPITLATRMRGADIRNSLTLNDKIITISSVSDELMAVKWNDKNNKNNYKRNIDSTVRELERAKRNGVMEIGVACEDASRANLDFLTEYFGACGSLADYFIYCDTNGIANPDETRIRINHLVNKTGMSIMLHCHNDNGLAVENTTQGIIGGADGISTTLTGIGERAAGNAPTEEVLYDLKKKGFVVRGVNYDQLDRVVKKVKVLTPENQPAIVGHAIQTSGMHIHALQRARNIGIEVYTGKAEEYIPVRWGVSSAKSTLTEMMCQEGFDVDPDDEAAIVIGLKNLAMVEKKSFTPAEVKGIVCTGDYKAYQDWTNIPELNDSEASRIYRV